MTRQLAIAFAGTPEFAVPTLQGLLSGPHRVVVVYTQPDRPAGRGRRMTESPIKRLARDAGLPTVQPASLRTDAAAAALAAHAPDVLVVVAYGLLLPRTVLTLPPLGCVNVHASLLPRWRGAAPIQRAIEAGDTETGISIMLMDEGLDTGPVLATLRTPIGSRETAGSLHDRLAGLGASLLRRTIDDLARGRVDPQPQPARGATYARKIHKDEARLDFDRPAAALDRQIRAFNPWPVAETSWHGTQLRVFEAVPVARTCTERPGTVIGLESGALEVATGDGVLALERVQLAGRRIVTGGEFAQGTQPVGQALGT